MIFVNSEVVCTDDTVKLRQDLRTGDLDAISEKIDDVCQGWRGGKGEKDKETDSYKTKNKERELSSHQLTPSLPFLSPLDHPHPWRPS